MKLSRHRHVVKGAAIVWADTPWVDAWLALGLVGTAVVARSKLDLAISVANGWLLAVGALVVGLLGVALTAVTIVFSVGPGPRLRTVLSLRGPALNRLLMNGVWSLTVIAFCLIVVLPVLRVCPCHKTLAALGLSILAALRFARTVFLLQRILDVFAAEASD